MIQNQLVDLPVDERSAEKIAYSWVRGNIGNIPHVGTPVKKDDVWSVPIHVNYPRIFKDIATERPQKLRFMSFKDIGEVKINAVKQTVPKPPNLKIFNNFRFSVNIF